MKQIYLSIFIAFILYIVSVVHASDIQAASNKQIEVRIPAAKHKPGQNTGGTAFLINSNRIWMTARHVVDDCKAIYLYSQFATTLTSRRTKNITKSRFVPAKLMAVDSNSDAALLVAQSDLSNKAAQPLALGKSYKKLMKDDLGFIIGYPKGQHGEVALTYEKRVLAEQGFRTGTIRYEMDRWAIKNRNTVSDANQGLSGGPVINRQGAVVGINAAGLNKSKRFLGSSSTVPLDAVMTFLKKHKLHRSLARQPNAYINELSYKSISRNMRKNQQVVKVYCER